MEGESMSKWKELRAQDFCFYVTDGTHDSPKRRTKGYYLLTSKHIGKDTLDFESAYKISEDDYLKIIERSKVEQYDILYSMIGTIGNVHIVKEDKVNFAVKNMGIFKFNGDYLHSLWMYYWLKSTKATEYIKSRLSGSTQQYITLSSLRDFPISIPEIDIMRLITGILSSLDAKIETNNKLNEKLEEMAQAIFKSWFVDFEPFKDKPFHETELGMIPEGWNVCCLGDITKQTKEKVGSNRFLKVLSPINTGELTLSEDYFTKQVYSKDISKYILVRKNNFAYNPARVNIGSLGRNEYDFDGCVSPVYVVFEVIKEYENFFDLFRRQKTFINSVISLAIGGVRQSLSYNDFSYIKLVVPPKNVIEKFNDIYAELDKLIKTKKIENDRLASLRDTLLPRLMSGELIV